MFGHSFFGARYYGPRYFGPASGVTPTPTPTPTPAVTSAGLSWGIQDKYWRDVERRYEKKKKQAKKKSKKAVEIIEGLARKELDLSVAIGMLHEELAAANLKNQEVYVELLKLKLQVVEEEEADDALLLLH